MDKSGTKESQKQDLQSATSHKQEFQQKHKTAWEFSFRKALNRNSNISNKIASVWVPFIGHLAAFPPANMVVKSRSTGGAATKGKNQKKVSGYNQEVIPFYMIENTFHPSFVTQSPHLKDTS